MRDNVYRGNLDFLCMCLFRVQSDLFVGWYAGFLMLKKMIHHGAVVRDLTKLRRRPEQERLKHNRFYEQSNNSARASLFFVYFFRHCTTRTWKCLISRFIDEVNKQPRDFLSLSKLQCGPQEINSIEPRLRLSFSANWYKRNKLLKKTWIHYESDIFATVDVGKAPCYLSLNLDAVPSLLLQLYLPTFK